MPRYQKISEMVKYVLTAKKSHISGLRNCGQARISRYPDLHDR